MSVTRDLAGTPGAADQDPVRPDEAPKAPERPVGAPSGPGSAIQTGQAMPGKAQDGTPGEAMIAPVMPGEDSGAV